MHGKQRRLGRLFNRQSGKTLMVPIDHAVTMGPAAGLENPQQLVNTLVRLGVNAVIGHKGVLKHFHDSLSDTPFILHLSGSTNLGDDPGYKAVVGDVEAAVAMGADAVSVHITLGHAHEREMLADFGRISAQCDRFGMPLLAMVYLDKSAAVTAEGVAPELHGVRVAQELGADIIKLADPGDDALLAEIVTSLQVPVVVGGGSRQGSVAFLQRINAMMASGISGIAVGRNIFQSADIETDFSRLYAAVHNVPVVSVLGQQPARFRQAVD
jgi:DhnA family fructose-bisphosphate aldolase class Ia